MHGTIQYTHYPMDMLFRIAVYHSFCCFAECIRYILAASVRMYDKRMCNSADFLRFLYAFHYMGCFQCFAHDYS